MKRTALVSLMSATALIVGLACMPSAQTPSSMQFEVATVKANTSGAPNGNLRPSAGGRVDAVNFPLDRLIGFAYNLLDYRLVGAPNWTTSARYDIVAKLPNDSASASTAMQRDPIQDIRDAVLALLIERFKLSAHKETRQLDIYALVLAHPGGKPTAAVKPSTVDCNAVARAQRAGGQTPAGPSEPGFCGVLVSADGVHVGGVPLSMVTGVLSAQVGRVVEDRTGLTGAWDFDLKFTPMRPGANLPPDSDAPSIFTAVEEQLGLKLSPTKAPVEVTVIDHVERPSED